MIKYSLILIMIFFIIGCSSKTEDALIQKYQVNKNHYKYLLKTEKVQFKDNNVTKVLLTATYMNKATIDINDKSDEVFLIGVYSEESRIHSLTSEDLNITLKEVKTKKEKKEEADKEREERKKARLILATLEGDDKKSNISKKKKKKEVYLAPKKMQILEKNSPLLKGISFVSEWSQFYLVHYKHVAGNRLTLQIRSKKSKLQMTRDKVKAQRKIKKKSKENLKNKNKKIKVKSYNTKTLTFTKVAKYAL